MSPQHFSDLLHRCWFLIWLHGNGGISLEFRETNENHFLFSMKASEIGSECYSVKIIRNYRCKQF